MKNILIALNVVIWTLVAAEVTHAAETKKVCHEKVVKGKKVEQCKTIKIHKKFEGTKISDVKPVVQPKPVKKATSKKK